MKILYSLLAKLVIWETNLATNRGRAKKAQLKEKYPPGLHCHISRVICTRGKIGRLTGDLIYEGYFPTSIIMDQDSRVYEVVYQATPIGLSKQGITISLFSSQADLTNMVVNITEYGCIRHPFHYLYFLLVGLIKYRRIWRIPSSEIYPQEWEVLG